MDATVIFSTPLPFQSVTFLMELLQSVVIEGFLVGDLVVTATLRRREQQEEGLGLLVPFRSDAIHSLLVKRIRALVYSAVCGVLWLRRVWLAACVLATAFRC